MDINKDTVFIHYGDVFDTEKFKEIKNANTPWVKPNGGYWASPVESNNGWKDWCLRENFLCFGDRYKNIDKHQKFTIAEDAKILYLRNEEEIMFLKETYESRDSLLMRLAIYPDYEKIVADGYQAIYYEDNSETHYPLICWDCDSLLVMDPTIINIIKEEN